MLKFVTKEEYWNIEDKEILKKLPNKFQWHLKSIQDGVAFDSLHELKNKVIGEVGGGDSRILEYLCKNNSTYNIDYFEGEDGGPAGEVKIDKVTNIFAHLGEFSENLKDNFFDYLFSVSVVEHVPYREIPAFFEDCARILKPGGKMIHLIDAYLDEVDNSYITSRIKSYQAIFDNKLFIPDGEYKLAENNMVAFKTDYASNPDNMMQVWNKSAPHLRPKRASSQSVTLLLSGTKPK
jgi:SAM-dependent methyltransferase